MEQYIPKTVILAEINKLKGKVDDGSSYCNGWQHALRMLEIELNTVELKEIDLEKEIKEVQREYKTIEEYEGYPCTIYADDIKWIAKYFFELGLKTKGE